MSSMPILQDDSREAALGKYLFWAILHHEEAPRAVYLFAFG